jgi:uncharacterized protein (TIGR02996 family)
MRFEYNEGTSSKFWEIELQGKSFTASWGRIGTTGQSKKQTFKSAAEAQRAHDKLVAEKLKKGYLRVGGEPTLATSLARDVKLEEAIRAAPDDPAPYLVYADWLQAQGSPHGELITVQHALAEKPKDRKLAAREKTLLEALALPPPDLATVGWRWGFFEWLRLENKRDWMDDSFDALALARPLFAAPMCAALRELRLGVLRWEHNEEDVPAVLAEAARQPWAASLQRLHLGDVGRDIDLDHHVIGDVGKLISKVFPALTWLKLHSGGQSWHGKPDKNFGLAGLDLPGLRELTVETCSMSKKRLKALLAAKLPHLERLELWFGSRDYGADATVRDLQLLLGGEVFPGVTQLGLRNFEKTEELARQLPDSPIAARLETLDLSMGTLSDEGAGVLAKGARAFSRLRTLDVDDSFLTPDGVKALRAAFSAEVISRSQTKEEYEEGERYVSVGE